MCVLKQDVSSGTNQDAPHMFVFCVTVEKVRITVNKDVLTNGGTGLLTPSLNTC